MELLPEVRVNFTVSEKQVCALLFDWFTVPVYINVVLKMKTSAFSGVTTLPLLFVCLFVAMIIVVVVVIFSVPELKCGANSILKIMSIAKVSS